MMTHVFGSTVLAVSTVLAAFMAGLALGSYYLGKRSHVSTEPMKRYAMYEFGIGGGALVVLILLDHITPLSIWMTDLLGSSPHLFHSLRFIVVFLLILIPTTLMGATLPILSQLILTRPNSVGRGLSSLYATNTVGAVAGCLLAGFFLIGSIGIHNSIYVAASLNICVGVASWLLASRQKFKLPENKEPASKPINTKRDQTGERLPQRLRLLLLWGFAFSGLTAFAYEVLWTRSLIFFMGNSTYAFTVMLTTFLVGIALGGYVVRFFVDRLKDPIRFFAWVQLAIGVSAVSAMPLLDVCVSLAVEQEWIGIANAGWGSVMVIRFAASFVVMLIPALLIGMTFPLVGKILVRNLDRSGEEVGKIYAINTLGNIVGALLPAFLLIPLLGIHKSIMVMAVVNVGIGLLILAYRKSNGSPLRHLAPVALVVLVLLAVGIPKSPQFPSNTQETGDRVLYYKEGIAATTKVFQKPSSGYKHISVDGIQIGGSDPGLDYKQQWLAHLPKLLLNEYKTEMSVGLGSGILVGESARHEGLEKIICLEIAPSVVEGAAYFKEENYGVLESPKVEIVVNDAVNYLLTSQNKYDIISTDGKTKPEYGVNGVFFSEEYYALMRDHLAPGGVAIQWVPIHYPPEIFKTVLNTFCQTFPHALVFYAEKNCFLVGSNEPVTLDPGAIDQKLSDPRQPYDGLRKFGISSAASLIAQLVGDEDAIRDLSASGHELSINSMEKPIIEFYDLAAYQAPVIKTQQENLEFLISIRGQGKIKQILSQMPDRVKVAHEAEGLYLLGQRLVLAETKRAELENYFDKALDLDPDNQHLRHHIYPHYLKTGKTLMEHENWKRAEIYLSKSVETWPNDADAHYQLGFAYMVLGRGREALREYETSLRLDPKGLTHRHSLADTYLISKMNEDAIRHFKIILQNHPKDIQALRGMGEALIQQKNFQEALIYCQKAYVISPNTPEVIDSYAWAAYLSGNIDLARKIVSQKGTYPKGVEYMKRRRKMILQQ